MSQNVGIFIDGRNPKSKKEIKDRIKNGDLQAIEVYSTSQLQNFTGMISCDELVDDDYYFVGPDPYTSRKFYGVIEVRGYPGQSVKVK